MEESDVQRIVRLTSLACAFITVETPEGDQGIGTAFHIGEGVYLTARHVIEGNRVLSVVPHTRGILFKKDLRKFVPTNSMMNGEIPTWSLNHSSPKIADGPYYHENANIDVAAFRLRGIDINTPHLVLGGHYDDWINDEYWMLSKATAFGYPPIPLTNGPVLVAASVEINAVIDTRLDRYVRFVVSGAPRGGFSGGPVFHEWGFVLGMTIESLERQGAKHEGGFFTVLSIESLRECLENHGLLPEYQRIDS
ncbi:S1 family peptidase [Paracoccus denitrificans]|jgi:hypothetical protein|uniref:Peptidase C24, Calicivirus polyprotein ORF 1 n=1 Tax=Paracoccus denitrificans (strain Pd 1222) TaxID=318586 RepID=A1B6R4_PARDP|nr:serine protease [Paracoccus denitrificans]ABL71208.1 Peptidase C24, Calicivirus polyprotein ORF 1 [Paracoccus denitrificans PD1222]MBB4628189.1 hypothetical protein [Paracoccus denitrificans]MCU7429253.1 serine protease [Paracoccus denitrificans]QAR27848.1 serine protease [Paracoccus denitrificans]UPV97560.1 serine protease [Paracoccus denitrificans]